MKELTERPQSEEKLVLAMVVKNALGELMRRQDRNKIKAYRKPYGEYLLRSETALIFP